VLSVLIYSDKELRDLIKGDLVTMRYFDPVEVDIDYIRKYF